MVAGSVPLIGIFAVAAVMMSLLQPEGQTVKSERRLGAATSAGAVGEVTPPLKMLLNQVTASLAPGNMAGARFAPNDQARAGLRFQLAAPAAGYGDALTVLSHGDGAASGVQPGALRRSG